MSDKAHNHNPQQLSGVSGNVTMQKIGPFTVWGMVYTGLLVGGVPTADRTAVFNANLGNHGRQFIFTNMDQWETFSATDAQGNYGSIIFQGFDPSSKALHYAYMTMVVSGTAPTTMPSWTIGTITLDDPVVIEQSGS